jgi:hypothetical protein
MGPIGCLETSVRIYHYMLRKNPERRRSQVRVSIGVSHAFKIWSAPKWAGRGSLDSGQSLFCVIHPVLYNHFMLLWFTSYKNPHDRFHITMHKRAHVLFNTKLTLQLTERRRTSHDALTTGDMAGEITNTMLFMS